MWDELYNFFVAQPPIMKDGQFSQLLQPATTSTDVSAEALEAIAYYCPLCKTGFKNRGAKKNHVRLKHKPKGEVV